MDFPISVILTLLSGFGTAYLLGIWFLLQELKQTSTRIDVRVTDLAAKMQENARAENDEKDGVVEITLCDCESPDKTRGPIKIRGKLVIDEDETIADGGQNPGSEAATGEEPNSQPGNNGPQQGLRGPPHRDVDGLRRTLRLLDPDVEHIIRVIARGDSQESSP
ncbi:MAG: hypothetical protein Q9170_005682 [Blastenia crenularia]